MSWFTRKLGVDAEKAKEEANRALWKARYESEAKAAKEDAAAVFLARISPAPVDVCPKCNSYKSSREWRWAYLATLPKPRETSAWNWTRQEYADDSEHLYATCEGCGYSWPERCADYKES